MPNRAASSNAKVAADANKVRRRGGDGCGLLGDPIDRQSIGMGSPSGFIAGNFLHRFPPPILMALQSRLLFASIGGDSVILKLSAIDAGMACQRLGPLCDNATFLA